MIVKRQQVTEMSDSESPCIASGEVECLAKLSLRFITVTQGTNKQPRVT